MTVELIATRAAEGAPISTNPAADLTENGECVVALTELEMLGRYISFANVLSQSSPTSELVAEVAVILMRDSSRDWAIVHTGGGTLPRRLLYEEPPCLRITGGGESTISNSNEPIRVGFVSGMSATTPKLEFESAPLGVLTSFSYEDTGWFLVAAATTMLGVARVTIAGRLEDGESFEERIVLFE